jgi:hypothetical protein
LGDIDGIASTLWSIAQIRLAQEDPAKSFECLQDAWSLFLRHGRAEGIAVVGALYGQFLAVIEPDEAPAVFRQSTAAFRKLGRDAEAEQVEAMLRDLNNPQQNPGNE